MAEPTTKRLYRSTSNRVLGGVCGGLAEYFDIDPTLVRIIFVALTISGGVGLGLYVLLWIVIPEHGQEAMTFGQRAEVAGQEMRTSAQQVAESVQSGNRKDMRNVFGWGVVLFGAALLLNQIYPSWVRWDLFWPIALILIGVSFIVRRK